MPVYIKLTDIRGDVTPASAGRGPGGGPHVKVLDGSTRTGARPKVPIFLCPSDSSAVEVSRISLMPGGAGVEGRDPATKIKVEQIINTARRQGKLYLATDAGVFARSGAVKLTHSNNLKQITIAPHNTATVEIIVTDAGGMVVGSHRLQNVSVTRSSGTFTLTFNGQTTGG